MIIDVVLLLFLLLFLLQRGDDDDDAVSFEFLNMSRGGGEERGEDKRGRNISVCPSSEKGM
jgi:hypothetical protein